MVSAGAATFQEKYGDGPAAKDRLRLWLKLFTCTSVVEKRIRNLFRSELGSTLPRFDLLATLDHAASPLTMGQLSERLLVSNGNVTGLVARLETEGLLTRRADPRDGRSFHVSLTAEGKTVFAHMALEHEGWIEQMFAGLGESEIQSLMGFLDRVKSAISNGESGNGQ